MRTLMRATILGIILLHVAGYALAQNEANKDVQLVSKAEIEVTITNDKGESVVVRQPAEKIKPGVEVIFTNTLTNVGNKPASNIAITNPISEHMVYVEGSAFGEAAITFSADGGKSFNVPEKLTVPAADGSPMPATAQDFTHIQWRWNKPLAPQQIHEIGFKAKVK